MTKAQELAERYMLFGLAMPDAPEGVPTDYEVRTMLAYLIDLAEIGTLLADVVLQDAPEVLADLAKRDIHGQA
jgi:hypothetical protein